MTSRSRPIEYTDDELREIARSVGVPCIPDHTVAELNAASAAYYYSSLSDQPKKGETECFGRSWGTRSNQLRTISRLATRLVTSRSPQKLQVVFGLLMHELRSLDAITSQYLQLPQALESYEALGNILTNDEARFAFALLRSAAGEALKQVPRRPGRPRDSRFQFVQQLTEIYQHLTGRKIGFSRGGPFSRFVKAAISPISPRDVLGINDVARSVCRSQKPN